MPAPVVFAVAVLLGLASPSLASAGPPAASGGTLALVPIRLPGPHKLLVEPVTLGLRRAARAHGYAVLDGAVLKERLLARPAELAAACDGDVACFVDLARRAGADAVLVVEMGRGEAEGALVAILADKDGQAPPRSVTTVLTVGVDAKPVVEALARVFELDAASLVSTESVGNEVTAGSVQDVEPPIVDLPPTELPTAQVPSEGTSTELEVSPSAPIQAPEQAMPSALPELAVQVPSAPVAPSIEPPMPTSEVPSTDAPPASAFNAEAAAPVELRPPEPKPERSLELFPGLSQLSALRITGYSLLTVGLGAGWLGLFWRLFATNESASRVVRDNNRRADRAFALGGGALLLGASAVLFDFLANDELAPE